ncbi:hypothetical protein BRC99_03425 [Halobacteriales archaeon QS_7_69_60]|nr:MAG: hypothetical protein BRC99_03425 [Halobacteriales archaeon QS_7_69_60]
MPDQSANTMRERAERSNLLMYFLLNIHRLVVTFLVLVGVFVGIVGASLVIDGAAVTLVTGDPVATAFQSLIGATVTGVTLVLTLNQLVLSQELGALDDQYDRMEGAMTFREEVGDLIGETPPAEPSAFLCVLIEAIADRARAVGEAVDDGDEDAQHLVDVTTGNADAVLDRLDGAEFGEFEVVQRSLDFNYSWKLYATNRLTDERRSEEAQEALEDLSEALGLFGPAREHFKTLYFQSELINLSRTVLNVSVPSLVTATAFTLLFDPKNYPGTVLGLDVAVLLVAAAAAIAVAPFAVLLAYILRIATITRRTLAIGPFVLRDSERDTQE